MHLSPRNEDKHNSRDLSEKHRELQ